MAVGTLETLLELLSSPEMWSIDAQGKRYVRAQLDRECYTLGAIKAVKNRGFDVRWEHPKLAHIYRGAATCIPADMSSGTRLLGKKNYVRDSTPDRTMLSELGLWLFEHYVYGLTMHCSVARDDTRRVFILPGVRAGELDEDYWNRVAEEMQAAGYVAVQIGLAKRRIHALPLPSVTLMTEQRPPSRYEFLQNW